MSGKISVTSELGKGATFKVYLPNVKVVHINKPDSVLTPTPVVKVPVFNHAKVLVVDDVPDNRELLKQILLPLCLEILEASNGQEAVDLCKAIQLDLILMDIRMPVMDGYLATKLIKTDYPDLPVIAITASVSADDMEKIQSHKFDDSLRKPVLKDDLLHALMKFLKFTDPIGQQPKEEVASADNGEIKMEFSVELKRELSTSILPLFVEADASNNLADIKQVALTLKEVAINYNHMKLMTLANDLILAVDNFDIQAMRNHLSELKPVLTDN